MRSGKSVAEFDFESMARTILAGRKNGPFAIPAEKFTATAELKGVKIKVFFREINGVRNGDEIESMNFTADIALALP